MSPVNGKHGFPSFPEPLPWRAGELPVNRTVAAMSPAATGYAGVMTDPNDDMSSIADPGSMDAGAMTEPDNGNPGDLDHDHEHLAGGGPGTPGDAVDSPAAQGSPVGPPD